MEITVKFEFPKDLDDRIPNEFIFDDALKAIPFKDVSYRIINRIKSGTITFDFIEKSVCDYIYCTPEEIQRKTRKGEVLIARQLCHYIALNCHLGSPSKIGKRFGNKDRNTVLSSNRKILDLLRTSQEFRNMYKTFIASFFNNDNTTTCLD